MSYEYKSIRDVMEMVTGNEVYLPAIQRKFVWKNPQIESLFDSIMRGYPIGTLIFWKTKDRLRSVRNIGECPLPEPQEGDFVEFVLDGQQRLTALFASLKGLKIQRDTIKVDDFAEVYIDLEAKKDEQIVITDVSGKDPSSVINLKIHVIFFYKFYIITKEPSKGHRVLAGLF